MTDKCVFVLTRDPDVAFERFAFVLRHKLGPVLVRDVPAISTVALTLNDAATPVPTVDVGRVAHPAEAVVEVWAEDPVSWSGIIERLRELASSVQAWRVRETTIWDYSESVPVGRAPWTGMLMFGERLAGTTQERYETNWAVHGRNVLRVEELRATKQGSLGANLSPQGSLWIYRQDRLVEALTDGNWPIAGYAEMHQMTSDPWWSKPLASSAAGGGSPEGADFEFEPEEPFFSPDIVRVVQGEYWILARNS